ncbi:MAG: NRDE family protein [Desulfobacterales bacterium]|nr:NRDE family protein [Desulfobacterales bacterium]
MCLILLSYCNHPSYGLILAANRDEFYDRPTAPLGFWDEAPHILAGRDLKSGGTWLGVTKNGRFCAVTNYRDPAAQIADAPSRGLLVENFLKGTELPERYLQKISKDGHRYNGFNLLAGDLSGFFYCSNRSDGISRLSTGIHGLSNHLLDTQWPKVEKGKRGLEQSLSANKINCEDIFELLSDRVLPPDGDLPDTGVGMEWERLLSPLFIRSEIYGTRSSSIVLIDEKRVTFMERTYTIDGTGSMKHETRQFSIELYD